ncbi:MAG: Hsp33 family molecular chaperone HslO [Candidatus Cloacimonadota bacterium]
MKEDKIYRATTLNDQFRIMAVDSTHTAQRCRDLHDLSPLATLLMSRMISAVAMMSLDLKNEEADLSLRIEGKGPLKGALVVINGRSETRGYAFEPKLFLSSANENFLPGKQLLPGTLTLIRSSGMKSPYTGMIELVTGDVAEDLAHYYAQSEQIPTAVNLGVLIDQEARVRASGGLIIQQLPQADPHQAELLIDNLNQTPNLSDLMDMGLDVPEILERFVLKGLQWQMHDARPLVYKCNCSKERFANALRLLGKNELQQMQEGISPICHYCNTSYNFSPEEILELIKGL